MFGSTAKIVNQFPKEYSGVVLGLRASAQEKARQFESLARLDEALKEPNKTLSIAKQIIEGFRRAGRECVKSVSATRNEIKAMRVHPTIACVQDGQRPLYATVDCSDSRLADSWRTLHFGRAFRLTNIGGSLEDQSDPNKISSGAKEFLAVAVERLNTPNILLITHGLCACIENADVQARKDNAVPLQPIDRIFNDMGNKKKHLIEVVKLKGAEHFLSLLPASGVSENPQERHLQAVELAHAEHNLRLTQQFMKSTLPAFANMTNIYSIYFDLRSMSVYLRHPDSGKYLAVYGGARPKPHNHSAHQQLHKMPPP